MIEERIGETRGREDRIPPWIHRPPLELLEATHCFPGVYQIKAIGSAQGDFEARVLDAVRAELEDPSELDYTLRKTSGGRHIALTLHVPVRDAAQVRAIYSRIQELDGLMLLL